MSTSMAVESNSLARRTKTSDARDEEWDAFLATHPDRHHEQCSKYGQIRASYGFQCDRVVVRKGGRIVGGLQLMVQSTPLGRFAVALRGPLATNDSSRVLSMVVQELDRLAQRRSYASVRIETFPTQAASRAALAGAGFRSSRAWFGERPSLVVRLAHSDDELLKRMKPKGRYNIHLAQRAGVSIRVGDGSSVRDFVELHEMTASHQGFLVFSPEYFEYIWRVFGTAGRAQHFLAYHDGRPVAAIFNSIVGGRMYYGWGGLNRGPQERKLMANYLVHFAAMGWAREHGCTHYDLVGVTTFKQKIARDEIQWPLPQWKFYGPTRVLRRALTERAWSTPAVRRAVQKVARRLGLLRQMPW